MSPSEKDLRSALRAGEGEAFAPDADTIMQAARGARHTRRVRIAAVTATVVVVGGLGIGLGVALPECAGGAPFLPQPQ